ncbi:ABC transporter substrate-binding protein [Oleomonas cavernae]|uniref:ABC transporter substrate-binding protein n=1 Tax=Oleomonas cavernae TaxID=2320859 RepID=A0A418W8K8_9PROT|nr:ABC transporter substrate-binding protein [Oleomonas cavernae]RJF86339.1 ABC transporter substrate-binding protein [Oleomonas cavernae]
MTVQPNIQGQAQANPVSEIWYTRCPVPTTSGIAQHFRWIHQEFERHGIKVESIRAAADQAVRNSHYSHTQPASFREGGNVPPIWTRANGQDTVVVGITWVDEEQLILVRPDSDIKTLADLKGRRFGVPKHDTKIVDIARGQDLRGLLTALDLAGLTPADVEFVNVAGGEFDLREQGERREGRRHGVVEALLAGTVDVIYAKGAVSAALVVKHGLHPIIDINANPDPFVRVNAGTPRPITVNRDLAVERPDIVARYLAILLKTAAWAKENPTAVVKAIAAETSSTEEIVRKGYGPELHLHFDVKLTEQYIAALRKQKDYLLEWGFLKEDFDFDGWILPGPLELARALAADDAIKITL